MIAGAETDPAPPPETPWQLVLRLRPLLAGVIGLVFATGQVAEALLLDEQQIRLPGDMLLWGLLGAGAVWISLTWVSRQEHRYQADTARLLREQQALNHRLERANSHLALLSAVNRHIADSTSLDAILDAALAFPQKLVPAQAAALLLLDGAGATEARSVGAPGGALAAAREVFGIGPGVADRPTLRPLRPRPGLAPEYGACLVLPLHDGVAPLGWMEFYLAAPLGLAADEAALLETIATEIAEAIMSARRRSREERAAYELERALADERARIARDIHDGIAQSLASIRMRVDLWRDWIADDPARLRAELGALKGTLREQIGELRRAIFALRPVAFDELGFVGGLYRYIEEFANQHGWALSLDLGGAPATLSPGLEAVCFRVIQEGLTNSAKHASATEVGVRLERVDGGLRVIIRDNGCGFLPGQLVGPADGVGLRQMRERLAVIRGQLTVLSRPGAGTEIRAWLPLPAPDEEAPDDPAPPAAG